MMKYLFLLLLALSASASNLSRDFALEIARNGADNPETAKYRVIHKFGSNEDVGTSEEDIWINGGIYTWLKTTRRLEAIADSAADDSAGTGAWSIVVEGLDANYNEIQETIVMNGTTATDSTTQAFVRVNRAYVTQMGTYHDGNAGNITIRIAGGGAVQAVISGIEPDKGQTQIARYTVPSGYRAWLVGFYIEVQSTKSADFHFWQYRNANDTTSVYSGAKRLVFQLDGIESAFSPTIKAPIGPFPAMTDLWFSALASAVNTNVSADFEIWLEKID